jgi:hypothetical protein
LIPTLSRAGAVTKITSLPFTITASGNYKLTGNLTADGTDGIDVNASNVVIDLNGFSITQSSAGNAIGVYDLSSGNVVVQNGTISGFLAGVSFGNGPSSGNCVAQNLQVFCAAPMLAYSSDCLVEDCFLIGNGAESGNVGIVIGGSNSQVQNCHISQFDVGVISIEPTATGSAFIHNYISGCMVGLQLSNNDYYQGNVVTTCTVSFTGGHAVGTENGGH